MFIYNHNYIEVKIELCSSEGKECCYIDGNCYKSEYGFYHEHCVSWSAVPKYLSFYIDNFSYRLIRC